ncbi:Pyruvate kinase [Operophtera brumata]|uniref:Pyruvate kinase n=1 Tax=Operophtera brumata TaxID=104452 RepID=A0A0L7KM21_OPEBR|nr:Pyruvate kinase [Operophtera brumata]
MMIFQSKEINLHRSGSLAVVFPAGFYFIEVSTLHSVGQDFIIIKEGTEVTLTYNLTEYNKCNASRIFVDSPNLVADMKVGTEITVDQGEIIMRCEAVIDDNSLQCIVTKTGKLKSLCIVCGRGVNRTTPYVTKQDLHMVKFALEYQVSDAIMLSREFLAYELEASAVNRMMQIQKWVGAKCLRVSLIA